MNFLLSIVSLVILAKFFGELFERFGLPALLGELTAGMILGPALLGLITAETLANFALLGIILLLFLVGFDFDLEKARANIKVAVLLPVLGFLFVLVPTYMIFKPLGLGMVAAVFFTLIMGGESTPNTIKALIDLKKMRSKVTTYIISATVVEDFIFYTILAITAGMIGAESIFSYAISIGKVLLFFALFLLMEKAAPYIIKYSERMKTEEAQFTMAFVLILLLAFAAEYLGFASVTGAFFAGIALSYSPYLQTGSFTPKMNSFTYGVFAPLFFAWMGLQLTPETLVASGMVLTLMVMGIIAKLVGNMLGCMLAGVNWQESLGVSLGMTTRGGEQLLILVIAQQLGVFMVGTTDYLTSIVIPTTILTMLLTIFISPISLKMFFKWYGE